MRYNAARSIEQFAQVLDAGRVELVASALRRMPTIVGVPAVDRGDAIAMLADAFVRSLLFGKPRAFDSWAKRYAQTFATTGIVDAVVAVCGAILNAAESYPSVDGERLAVALKMLEWELFSQVAAELRQQLSAPARLHVKTTVDVVHGSGDIAGVVF